MPVDPFDKDPSAQPTVVGPGIAIHDSAAPLDDDPPAKASAAGPSVAIHDSAAPLDDDALTALAMAADPDAPIDDDAVPFGGVEESELLPAWYMPVPRVARRTRPRTLAVAAIVGSLLIVNGYGLCVTYGWPEIAW